MATPSEIKGRLDSRFAKIWGASTASGLGSGLTLIAAPLLVASRTRDPLTVSSVFVVSELPWLLFALPAGVLADRIDRRRLMIVLDLTRAVAMCVLAVAIVTRHDSILLLYAVLFLINTCEVTFRGAGAALMQAVVPRDQLERGNSWMTGGLTVAQEMVAGPLAAFLFVVAASLPFFVNAGTYLASVICIALLAGRYRATPEADAEPQSIRRDIAESFGWLMRQRLLRTMIILIGLLNMTLTAALAVLVLLVKERLHLGSLGYGTLFACMAVGGVLGSIVSERLIRTVTATWTIRVGLLIEAGTQLTLATATTGWVVGVVLFAFGIHSCLWNVVAESLIQRLTPPEMISRVASASLFLASGGNCLGAVLGGVIAASFGLTAPYWIGFAVAIAVSVTTWHVFSPTVVSAAYAAEPEPVNG
jgi:predicted MFS family arabinose efflux permease